MDTNTRVSAKSASSRVIATSSSVDTTTSTTSVSSSAFRARMKSRLTAARALSIELASSAVFLGPDTDDDGHTSLSSRTTQHRISKRSAATLPPLVASKNDNSFWRIALQT